MKTKSSTFFFSDLGLPNSPIPLVFDEQIDEDKLELKNRKPNNEQILPESDDLIFETFFSQMPTKFDFFSSLDFEQIPTELFLKTCEDYLAIFNKFPSPIFNPLKADVHGNIEKIRKKMNGNIDRFATLFSIVNDEIESSTTRTRNSATDALLWLTRAFLFIGLFLDEFSVGDKTFVEAIQRAYERSLRKYHGVLARSAFRIALRAIPKNREILRSLAVRPEDASESFFERQLLDEMMDHSAALIKTFNKIAVFYRQNGLETIEVIG